MEKPIDIGNKTIDAAKVHLIRDIAPERLGALANTGKNFTVEIRALGGSGGFVEDLSLKEVVAAFSNLGEHLTLLPGSAEQLGEAVRTSWVQSAKDFTSRPDQPAKFGSVVIFRHPDGATAEEWLIAKRSDVIPNTPLLSGLSGGPKGAS